MIEKDQRTWAGTTLDDRKAARRERLIDIGFQLLGEQGSAAVTVRGLARASRLSERYFYESFSGRDELLLAVHDRVAEQARAVITEAVANAGEGIEEPVLAALGAFTNFLEDDPRRGRVLLLESFSEETLARHGMELIPSFAALLIEQIRARFDGPDQTDAQLSSVALVGALVHLYMGWLEGSLDVDRERLIRHAAGMILGGARVSSKQGQPLPS